MVHEMPADGPFQREPRLEHEKRGLDRVSGQHDLSAVISRFYATLTVLRPSS